MTSAEEQTVMHCLSGLAQSVNALLNLISDANIKRAETDAEIVNLLKMISRKH